MLHDPGDGVVDKRAVGGAERLGRDHRAFAHAVRAARDRYADATGLVIDTIEFGPRGRRRRHPDADADRAGDAPADADLDPPELVLYGQAGGGLSVAGPNADPDSHPDAVADLSDADAGDELCDGRVEIDLTIAAVETFGHTKLILMAPTEAVLINCADRSAGETLLREISRLVHTRGTRA